MPTPSRPVRTPLAVAAVLSMLAILATADAQTAKPAAPAAPPGKAAGAGLGQEEVIIDEQTEKILKGSLKFLASRQQANGAWAANDRGDHQAAITGYVMIAFLSTGNLPGEGEHGKTMAKALTFLLSCVNPDGYIHAASGQHNMYGHGIAAIALAETYGQTKDPQIRTKLERVVKLIVSCQNNEGGWRYAPRAQDADISVTVLQVVALRAALNSGIEVPQKTIDNAIRYVRACAHPSGGFTYQARGGAPGFARSAAAIYSLQVCGQYEDPLVKKGSKYLIDNHGKDAGANRRHEWYSYGMFYAAPAQYMIGGDTWKQWYESQRKQLTASVKTRPGEDVSFWTPAEGDKEVNDIYTTAVYTTILAMPYHYIPLYQR